MGHKFFLDFKNLESVGFYNSLVEMQKLNDFELNVSDFYFYGKDRGMLFLSNILYGFDCVFFHSVGEGLILKYIRKNAANRYDSEKRVCHFFQISTDSCKIKSRDFLKRIDDSLYLVFGKGNKIPKSLEQYLDYKENLGFLTYRENGENYLVLSVEKLQSLINVNLHLTSPQFVDLVIEFLALYGCIFKDLNSKKIFQLRSKYKLLNFLGLELLESEKYTLNALRSNEIVGVSFGIVNNGGHKERVTLLVNSIKTMMKNDTRPYEIIIAGPTDFDIDDVVLLNPLLYSTNDVRGWITKKKNSIVNTAIYSDVFLLHDRIIFPKDFVLGKNCHSLTVFPVVASDDSKVRVNDWEKFSGDYFDLSRFRLYPMPYKKKTNHAMIYGGAFLVNKDVHQSIPLDERLYWGECEDIVQSRIYSYLNIEIILDSKNILFTDRTRLGGYKSNFIAFNLRRLFRFILTPKNKYLIKKVIKNVTYSN